MLCTCNKGHAQLGDMQYAMHRHIMQIFNLHSNTDGYQLSQPYNIVQKMKTITINLYDVHDSTKLCITTACCKGDLDFCRDVNGIMVLIDYV